MAVRSDLIHFSLLSKAEESTYAASERNNTFTHGFSGTVMAGVPDIAWDKVVFISEKKWIWTHGTMYDCSVIVDMFLSPDSHNAIANSVVYEALSSKQNAPLYVTIEEYKAIVKDPNTIYILLDDNGDVHSFYLGSTEIVSHSNRVDTDTELNPDSSNPVANYVITHALASMRHELQEDYSIPKLTKTEYDNLQDQGKIENKIYTIYADDVLQRVYIGHTLIMRKAADGEQVTYGGVFPLVFPIIFP